MGDLFRQDESGRRSQMPLAEKMRPRKLDELYGQEHIVGESRILRKAIENDKIPSMILWGPPGSGKTTLSMMMAKYSSADFRFYSAVTSGIKELKEVLAVAKDLLKFHERKTILFIDEIHRFNKAQQDAFLPYVEHGDIILIGATTENPSFEVNAALLSRCQVYILKALTEENLAEICRNALGDKERGLGEMGLEIAEDALMHISKKAHGDARAALNAIEQAAVLAEENGANIIQLETAAEAMQRKALRYDKKGDEHYNIISAFHKSIRGSDPDAAVYWLARMLEAGEDPKFLLRRMARMASEDIGLADPWALVMAANAQAAFDFIGLPEGKLALTQLAVYLSLAPKSNALEKAYFDAKQIIQDSGELDVPLHLRNAPTRLMKKIGYGKEYKYAHDYPGHWVAEYYLPDDIKLKRFYFPGNLGWEGKKKEIIEKRHEIIKNEQKNKQKNKQKNDIK